MSLYVLTGACIFGVLYGSLLQELSGFLGYNMYTHDLIGIFLSHCVTARLHLEGYRDL